MTQNILPADIAKLIDSVNKIEEKWKEKNSKSINLIQSMAWNSNTREEAHSHILADLLEIPFIKESFMNELLKDFCGFDNCDTYEVKREDGKVDVQLYSKGKEKIIIIENKINDAPEQKSQIARYVINYANKQINVPTKNIFVVYLNSRNLSAPSIYSLELSNGTNVYDKIDISHLKVLSYKHEITEWLKVIKQRKEVKEEPLLLSALEQYIYYLEVKFKNTDMEREMKSQIDAILGMNNGSAYEKFETLKELLEKSIPNLTNVAQDYKNEMAEETVKQWKEEARRWIEKEHIEIEMNYDSNAIDMHCWDDLWFVIRTEKKYQYNPIWMFWDNAEYKWSLPTRPAKIDKCMEIIEKAELVLDSDYKHIEPESQFIIQSRVPAGVSGVEIFKKVCRVVQEMKKDVNIAKG